MELHFELRHYRIRTRGFDSFNASIEQIIVLRPGQPRPTTVYKRKNPRDGPVRMNPNIALQKRIANSTSTQASTQASTRSTGDKENEGPSMSEKHRGKQKANPKDSGDKVEDQAEETL